MPKWYRIMTEGPTIDGREIKREWIPQMAASYNQTKYAARIWLEHLRGVFADGPFRAYGDVLALESREVENGRLGLFAQLAPHQDLMAMVNGGQKVFTSAEVDPDFAKSGTAYLVGLGITDSPASLGTDRLQFAAAGIAQAKGPDEGIMLSTPVELAALESAPAPGPSIAERVTAMFKRPQQDLSALRAEVEQAIKLAVDEINALSDRVSDLAPRADLAALRTEQEALSAKLAKVEAALDAMPDTPPLRPATGGPAGRVLTDY